MMNLRQKLLIFLAVGHLGLVALGAAYVNLRTIPVVGALLHSYSAYSGANIQYGFFAPNVGGQLRASFDLVDEKGDGTVAALRGSSHETDLRIGNIVSILWDNVGDERMRRTIAASWAAKMFSRHPATKTVGVRIESYELPNMEQYSRGERPFWMSFYKAKFVH